MTISRTRPRSDRIVRLAFAAVVSASLVLGVSAVALADGCRDTIESGMKKFAAFHKDASLVDQAVADYRKAAESPDCAYEAHWRLAELYLNHGTTLTSKTARVDEFKQGQTEALAAIGLNAQGPDGHYFYAVNLGSQIDTEGVMLNLLKAKKLAGEIDTTLKIDPDYPPALVVKARFMADMPGVIGGSDAKAEELFKKALSVGPDCESAYIEYARFLVGHKRYDEALALLEKVNQEGFRHANQATWTLIDKPNVKSLVDKVREAYQP